MIHDFDVTHSLFNQLTSTTLSPQPQATSYQYLPTMDENVDTFVSFTGATPDVARRYLGMTENNTEQAIQLFFDSPDLASSVGQGSQIAPPPIPTSTHPQRTASVGRQDEQGVVHIDSDSDDMEIYENDEQAASRAETVGRAADYEDDEAIARRMQEELYAGGDAAGGYDADGVRAPMARTTETLVGGPGGDWPPEDMNAAILQQLRSRHQPRSTGGTFLNKMLHILKLIVL